MSLARKQLQIENIDKLQLIDFEMQWNNCINAKDPQILKDFILNTSPRFNRELLKLLHKLMASNITLSYKNDILDFIQRSVIYSMPEIKNLRDSLVESLELFATFQIQLLDILIEEKKYKEISDNWNKYTYWLPYVMLYMSTHRLKKLFINLYQDNDDASILALEIYKHSPKLQQLINRNIPFVKQLFFAAMSSGHVDLAVEILNANPRLEVLIQCQLTMPEFVILMHFGCWLPQEIFRSLVEGEAAKQLLDTRDPVFFINYLQNLMIYQCTTTNHLTIIIQAINNPAILKRILDTDFHRFEPSLSFFKTKVAERLYNIKTATKMTPQTN